MDCQAHPLLSRSACIRQSRQIIIRARDGAISLFLLIMKNAITKVFHRLAQCMYNVKTYLRPNLGREFKFNQALKQECHQRQQRQD